MIIAKSFTKPYLFLTIYNANREFGMPHEENISACAKELCCKEKTIKDYLEYGKMGM